MTGDESQRKTLRINLIFDRFLLGAACVASLDVDRAGSGAEVPADTGPGTGDSDRSGRA